MIQDTEHLTHEDRVKNLNARCDYMLSLIDKWEEADRKKSLFSRIFG